MNADGKYRLNAPNLATLTVAVVVILGVSVFLGVCGYTVYDNLRSRLNWQIEPVIIHGYLIAAGRVEIDQNREYLNEFGISVEAFCPRAAVFGTVARVEAYSQEVVPTLAVSQLRFDGGHFSVVTPLDPEWIGYARQCVLQMDVFGDAPRAFSYGSFGSKQIKIISLSGSSD